MNDVTQSRELTKSEPVQVFDEEELLQRLMGDQELAIIVVNGFLEDVPKQLLAMQSFLDAGDSGGAASVAHGIKGAASMLSGVALSKAAGALEKAGNAGDLQAMPDYFSVLQQQFESLKTAMKSMKLGVEKS